MAKYFFDSELEQAAVNFQEAYKDVEAAINNCELILKYGASKLAAFAADELRKACGELRSAGVALKATADTSLSQQSENIENDHSISDLQKSLFKKRAALSISFLFARLYIPGQEKKLVTLEGKMRNKTDNSQILSTINELDLETQAAINNLESKIDTALSNYTSSQADLKEPPASFQAVVNFKEAYKDVDAAIEICKLISTKADASELAPFAADVLRQAYKKLNRAGDALEATADASLSQQLKTINKNPLTETDEYILTVARAALSKSILIAELYLPELKAELVTLKEQMSNKKDHKLILSAFDKLDQETQAAKINLASKIEIALSKYASSQADLKKTTASLAASDIAAEVASSSISHRSLFPKGNDTSEPDVTANDNPTPPPA